MQTVGELDQKELSRSEFKTCMVPAFRVRFSAELAILRLRQALDEERDPIAELVTHPLYRPFRLIFDDVVEQGRNNDLIVPYLEVFEQNERNGSQMFEVPLAGIAPLPDEGILGRIVGL